MEIRTQVNWKTENKKYDMIKGLLNSNQIWGNVRPLFNLMRSKWKFTFWLTWTLLKTNLKTFQQIDIMKL